MEAVDVFTALNYRADYSSRMAPGWFFWLIFMKCTCTQMCTKHTHGLTYIKSHKKAQVLQVRAEPEPTRIKYMEP